MFTLMRFATNSNLGMVTTRVATLALLDKIPLVICEGCLMTAIPEVTDAISEESPNISRSIPVKYGPVKYPCSVCAKPVRKRVISCEKCGLWIHKKCDPVLKLENNSSSICKPCQNKSHDNLDNVWVEFPFDDDFFWGQRNCFL